MQGSRAVEAPLDSPSLTGSLGVPILTESAAACQTSCLTLHIGIITRASNRACDEVLATLDG